MTRKQEQTIDTRPLSFGWFLRGAAYCVGGAGYLFGLFLERHTLFSLLLLTVTYGSWILIYHAGRRRSHPAWVIALSCLACASLFVPTQASNVYWLPILPSMTACVTAKAKPRLFVLLTAGTLWLATAIALTLVTGQLDFGSQVILLISFASNWGLAASISKLMAAHVQLHEYSAQIEELSVVRERNRIARDIHDTLGHSLTSLAVQLETAMQLEVRGDSRLHEELLAARQVTKACLREVRHSVEALRPGDVDARSLHEQLRSLVLQFETTCPQTKITLDFDEYTHPADPEVGVALYRCAQEALTNIRKHANATKVLLRLSTSGGRKDHVELTVLDNGRGSTPTDEHSVSGFGLLGMGERITPLGGTLRAGPESGHGWRVEAVLPRNIRE